MRHKIYLFVFIFSVLAFFSNGHYGGDGLENYLTAESIVLDHDLTIHDRPFEPKEIRYEARGLVDSKGAYSSVYGIGMPILLIPLYLLGSFISRFVPHIPHDYITQFTVSMANPAIIALTALVLFIFLEKLAFSRRTAFFTVICYSFCTISFIYARSGFSEPAIGFFVLLAMLLIYKYETTLLSRYLLYAVCCVGYTLLIKKNSFLYLPLIAAYLVYKSIKIKQLKPLVKLWLAVTLPVASFVLIYFYATAQSTFTGLVEDGTVLGYQMLKGLYYYFLSPGKGFFLYNLPLILALFAIKDFTKRRKELAIYIMVFILINTIYYSLKFVRGTLFSWGPRYIYPLVPFMCIFMAEFIENSRTVARKTLTLIFCISGFLIQLPALFVNLTNYLLFVKEKLLIQEYLINFMPELSPIKGTWWLFISAIKRLFTAVSLNFTYSLDIQFLTPVIQSLEGYDTWDVWWVNALKISPSLLPVVAVTLLVLAITAFISAAKIKQLIFNKT